MNTSSSLELSIETLEKSFSEYNVSEEENSSTNPLVFNINEIRNPVEKTVNQLARLQVDAHLGFGAIKKIIPIINETSDPSIYIPSGRVYLKNNVKKSIESVLYAKCSKCKEIGEIGICIKCNATIEKKSHFIYFPVEMQIKKSLIENFDSIVKYLHRQRSDKSKELTDTDDADIQKKAVNKFPDYKVLTFTVNIDGGQVTKKGTQSLWPVQLYQNYLHPSVRFLPENIIVTALFYGDTKPDPFDLMYPLLQDMRHLFDKGIQLIYDKVQYDFLPMILFASCDLPARALLQNFKCPTGADACPICIHPGIKNKEERIRIRYLRENIPSELRTQNDTVKHAHLDANCHGVKGTSCLMALPEFDIINSFSTDYMHSVFLGVVKRLLNIFLGNLKVNTQFKHLTRQQQAELNRRITSLQPYSKISHRPRSLDDKAVFRAIEYKYLLFYYLRYALRGLLEKKYIDHIELLSAAVYMLSKQRVRESDIVSAEKMLDTFCNQFEKFYGANVVTMNIHLLRHFGHVVRETGPLWCHSLFGFETNMGVLSKHYTGGINLLDQIAEKYIISKSIGEKIAHKKIPTFKLNLFSESQYDSLIAQHGLCHENKQINKSTHITIGKEIYKSMSSKPTKSIDYFFRTTDEALGAAQFYIIKDDNIFVLFNIYSEVKRNFHLIEVEKTEIIVVLPFESLKEKLLLLNFGSIYVACSEANHYEKS